MISLWHWHTEPLLIGGLLFFAWAYALLIGPFRDRFPGRPPFPKREAFCFHTGLIVFYMAVGSPLDTLGENFLFSAHMVQHKILMYISPVLIVLGLPSWLVDALLQRFRAIKKAWGFMVHPLIAGTVFTLVFSLWHIPDAYEAALTNKTIHAVEHLSMFGGSILIWWAILSQSREVPALSAGTRILYIFAITIFQLPVFVYLTFADSVHYPTYEFAPRIIPVEPLEDQILGGIIMKASGMFAAIAVIAGSFYAWSKQERRSAPFSTRHTMSDTPEP